MHGFHVGHGRQLGKIPPPRGAVGVRHQRFLHDDDALAIRQFVDRERDRQDRPDIEVVPQRLDGQRGRPGVHQDIPPETVREIAAEVIAEVDARNDLQPFPPDQPAGFIDSSLEFQVDYNSPSKVAHGSAVVQSGWPATLPGARTLPGAWNAVAVAALQIPWGGPRFDARDGLSIDRVHDDFSVASFHSPAGISSPS
jgi:hypothetical protein